MKTKTFSPAEIDDMVFHFAALAARIPLRKIGNSSEYDETVSALNALLDAGASNESHPLASLVDLLGIFVAAYDDRHYQLPDSKPADVLRVLMAQHGIRPTDLPEIGSERVVSEVLAGRCDLTTRQIADVSRRFGVSPTAFFPSVGRSSTDA